MQTYLGILTYSNSKVEAPYGMLTWILEVQSDTKYSRLVFVFLECTNSFGHLVIYCGVAGSAEVTQLLLEAGAVRDKENDIGKSASQLAGFVGHHQCVSVISSFIPLCVLEPYTVPQGSVLKL
jgi:hypothetical protein